MTGAVAGLRGLLGIRSGGLDSEVFSHLWSLLALEAYLGSVADKESEAQKGSTEQ